MIKHGTGLISKKYINRHCTFCDSDVFMSEVRNCVYFITDGIYTKIGIATDLTKRFSGLQTSNPLKLKALCIIPCKDNREMQKYELYLHRYFADNNVRGEWFDISEEDIQRAKNKFQVTMNRVVV